MKLPSIILLASILVAVYGSRFEAAQRSSATKALEFAKYLLSFRGYKFETNPGAEALENYITSSEEHIQLLSSEETPESMLALFAHLRLVYNFPNYKFIGPVASTIGLGCTFEIFKSETFCLFPITKESMEVLVEINNHELIREIFNSYGTNTVKRGFIGHLALVKGLRETREILGEEAYRSAFPMETDFMEFLFETTNPKLIKMEFESKNPDTERGEFANQLTLVKGFPYTLQTLRSGIVPYLLEDNMDELTTALYNIRDFSLIAEVTRAVYSHHGEDFIMSYESSVERLGNSSDDDQTSS